MVLRCTAKALDLLGVRRMSLVEVPPSDDDWYLNLLWFDRRKCLLLTHAGTVFSVFIPDVRKAELAPTGPYVIDAVAPPAPRYSTGHIGGPNRPPPAAPTTATPSHGHQDHAPHARSDAHLTPHTTAPHERATPLDTSSV